MVEENILGEAPGEASEEASFAPRKKKRKKTESTGVVCPSAYPIKIRLVKPFVLKSNNIWQPSDDEEEGDDNGDDADDDDDDESKEKDSWGGGKSTMTYTPVTTHFSPLEPIKWFRSVELWVGPEKKGLS